MKKSDWKPLIGYFAGKAYTQILDDFVNKNVSLFWMNLQIPVN